MEIKKLAAVAASAALLLSATVPVFAHRRSDDDLVITNRNTRVTNEIEVKANTGGNEVTGGHRHHGGGTIDTGSATIARVDVLSDVNNSTVTGCNCFDDVTITNTRTRVRNDVEVKANSGYNEVRGRGDIDTGSARVEQVLVTNYVNTTLVGETLVSE